MTKSVTYTDLECAAPEVEVHGVAFRDGEAVDVEDGVADALKGNRFFAVDGDTAPDDEDPTSDKFHTMGIAELRAEAEDRHINHDGKSKAQLREAIRSYDAAL